MAKSAVSLFKKEVKVPSAPRVLERLNAALSSSQTSISEIGEILGEDAALSGRLLELVNSSMYSLEARVETVSRAAVIVGTEQIRQLAIAATVISTFKDIPRDLIDMERFWHHGIGCGAVARKLAEMSGCSEPERFFLAGILHDVGRLVLFMMAPDPMHEVFNRMLLKGGEMYQAERKIFGFDHGEVGFELCRRWGLPAFYRELIRYHHDPESALHRPDEASILHVADVVAHALGLGESGQRFVPRLRESAWDRVQFTSDIGEELVQGALEYYEDALVTIL